MERLVAQKVEQLNKAMEKFNQEQDFHNRKRQEYERLIQKAQIEKRDFEAMKKKALEEVERLKEEELNKLKKEKKALEQRSKNLQLVGSSNKKEREEVDFLRKEVVRVQEEAKAKDQKQKLTIERLKKQVEDLTVRNKELSEELKHIELQRVQSMGA
jgi:centromere protein J